MVSGAVGAIWIRGTAYKGPRSSESRPIPASQAVSLAPTMARGAAARGGTTDLGDANDGLVTHDGSTGRPGGLRYLCSGSSGVNGNPTAMSRVGMGQDGNLEGQSLCGRGGEVVEA